MLRRCQEIQRGNELLLGSEFCQFVRSKRKIKWMENRANGGMGGWVGRWVGGWGAVGKYVDAGVIVKLSACVTQVIVMSEVQPAIAQHRAGRVFGL